MYIHCGETKGLIYELKSGDTYEVTGYTGTVKNVIIRSKHDGIMVTSIGEDVFRDNTELLSITISDSVTSIGRNAFADCSSLTSVYYTGNIASWCRISFGNSSANPLQYAHNLYINNTLVTEITIPDTVTKIYDYAFYKCSSLTSITIPDRETCPWGIEKEKPKQNILLNTSAMTASSF